MSTESLRERMARHADAAPTPASTAVRADDALKYAAAILADRYSWVSESIGCSEECGNSEQYGDDVHGDALGALQSTVDEIRALAGRCGDPRRYADGRKVTTNVDITRGLGYGHIWHPNPAEEKPSAWRGKLLSDPGVPCPGYYVVRTDPATQEVHVTVVRST